MGIFEHNGVIFVSSTMSESEKSVIKVGNFKHGLIIRKDFISEMKVTIVQLFWVALILRIVFIIIGYCLDSSGGGLQYTDIDYHVFSDAAELVAKGLSPYERSSYRYPPVLALLLVPNVYFNAFGKILFSIADSSIIFELGNLLEHLDPHRSSLYCWLWVFNIASINICTRGSADSITNYLVLLSLRLVICSKPSKPQNELVGMVLGVLVYLRVYPVIYLPAYVFYGIITSITTNRQVKEGRVTYDYLKCLRAVAHNTWVLFLSTFVTLALLMAVSYHYYREDYLQNAVLYHLSREDHRHNFSMHFYGIYLSKYTSHTYTEHIVSAFSQCVQAIVAYVSSFVGYKTHCIGDGGVCSVVLSTTTSENVNVLISSVLSALETILPSVLMFIPQLLIFSALIVTFADTNLPLCLLLQTIVFVSYNKVITAQYFSWYMCLVPVCMHSIRTIPTKVLLAVCLLWGATLAYWLYNAYLLEFVGTSVYFDVWVASVFFHIATTVAVCTIVCYAR